MLMIGYLRMFDGTARQSIVRACEPFYLCLGWIFWFLFSLFGLCFWIMFVENWWAFFMVFRFCFGGWRGLIELYCVVVGLVCFGFALPLDICLVYFFVFSFFLDKKALAVLST